MAAISHDFKDRADASSLEKGVDGPADFSSNTSDRYAFNAVDLDRVQRRLQQRHIQMCVSILVSRLHSWKSLQDRNRWNNRYGFWLMECNHV
jgi:hypothetical protein